MYLDFHTHHYHHPPAPVDSAGDQTISLYNVILGEEDVQGKEGLLSAGIHPWYIDPENWPGHLETLEALLHAGKIAVVGECGLDKIKGADWTLQTKVFQRQLEIADSVSKPVTIHCVRAFEETLSLCRPYLGRIPLIFHGFLKSPELADQLLNLGFELSFGPKIFNPQAQRLLDWLVQQDISILLETDHSNTDIRVVYQKFTNRKKISEDELKVLIFANWKNLGII